MDELCFYNREEAILRMNHLGSLGKKFFFLVNFDETECLVEELNKIPSGRLSFVFPEIRSVSCSTSGTTMPKNLIWNSFPQSFEEYSQSFDLVYKNLYAGNSFLTNLTCATPVHTNLSLKQVFMYASAKYKLLLDNRFVVFSPEIFIRIKDDYIYSYPMKGTIDASLPDASARLLNDEKESAEHATITDLIRNDLSQIATEVTVTRYRYLDELKTHCGTLLQMSSEIRGRLPDNYCEELGTLFFKLLPAGSITGAPKKKTVDIIREAETYERGFYTGVMGYFDGKNLDSAVLIRFLEQTENGLVYKSGGGITFQSDARSEYEEMIRKVYVPIY